MTLLCSKPGLKTIPPFKGNEIFEKTECHTNIIPVFVTILSDWKNLIIMFLRFSSIQTKNLWKLSTANNCYSFCVRQSIVYQGKLYREWTGKVTFKFSSFPVGSYPPSRLGSYLPPTDDKLTINKVAFQSHTYSQLTIYYLYLPCGYPSYW